MKALRLSPGQLLLQARLCGEELDAIAVESSHTIDIDCFVPKSEIDERYVDGPHTTWCRRTRSHWRHSLSSLADAPGIRGSRRWRV